MTTVRRPPLHDLLEAADWQMTYGERLALEGLVSSIRPRLALEIGSAEGGSLNRTALYGEEVHSFDMVEVTDPSAHPNVTYHTGDSHELLAPWLASVAEEGRTVDYALVDGDHSADGAQRDIEDILGSGVLKGAMLIHDTHNPDVRRGVERVRFEEFPSVVYVDLALLPGHMTRVKGFGYREMWGGLGLVLTDPTIQIPGIILPDSSIRQTRFYDPFRLTRPINRALRSPLAARAKADRVRARVRR